MDRFMQPSRLNVDAGSPSAPKNEAIGSKPLRIMWRSWMLLVWVDNQQID